MLGKCELLSVWHKGKRGQKPIRYLFKYVEPTNTEFHQPGDLFLFYFDFDPYGLGDFAGMPGMSMAQIQTIDITGMLSDGARFVTPEHIRQRGYNYYLMDVAADELDMQFQSDFHGWLRHDPMILGSDNLHQKYSTAGKKFVQGPNGFCV
jgi:hypothetical protein